MAITMTGFMDNYVDVATRLKMAFERWPELRIQETHREVIEMPDKSCFIRCVVTIWRSPEDLIPVIASACEIYPGKTSFTKSSESEVGYTSAIGRGLAMMGIGANKSIASRDEVQAAQSRQPTGRLAPVVPMHDVEMPFPDAPVQEYATPKQLGMMRALANGQNIAQDKLKEYCSNVLGRQINTTGDLTKRDVSRVIDALKLGEQQN
jgi:hypothetical protein